MAGVQRGPYELAQGAGCGVGAGGRLLAANCCTRPMVRAGNWEEEAA
jgi:hypothetical protein